MSDQPSFEFSDQFECLEAIATVLAGAVPGAWEVVRADVTLDGESVGTKVTYHVEEHGPPNGVGYVPYLARLFYELSRLLSTEGKGFYRQCSFTLRPNGKYSADYDYGPA